jgi:transketolase
MKPPLAMGRATRDAYGETLRELGRENPSIVVLDADLGKSTKAAVFGKEFPDRYFNAGIAEANMAGVASGLAACGKIPFISSFASFLIAKTYDQMRMGAAYSELPVKFVGSHGGVTLGEDGVSQMSIEDIALAATLPGFVVVVPADEVATGPLVRAVAADPRPAFIRTGRAKTWIVYEKTDRDFAIGKARLLRDGTDVAIVACGIMVGEALIAAEELAANGLRATVVDMHTIKPLDEATIARVAATCGAIVTAEEHQIWGGLGAAVAQASARTRPVPIESVAVMDTYAKSGTPRAVQERYGLTAREIVMAAKKVVARKK